MPHFTEAHPRHTAKYLGLEFHVPQVFAEGHVLTAAEAKGVNRWLSGTIGNQYAGAVRRAVEAGQKARDEAVKAKTYTGPWLKDAEGNDTKKPAPFTLADLDWNHQAEFETQFRDYKIGESNRGDGIGAGPRDPVAALVRFLAVEKIKELALAKGHKITDLQRSKHAKDPTKSVFNYLVDQYIGNHPELKEVAEAQLAATKGGVDDADEMDFEAIEAPAEEETSKAA